MYVNLHEKSVITDQQTSKQAQEIVKNTQPHGG